MAIALGVHTLPDLDFFLQSRGLQENARGSGPEVDSQMGFPVAQASLKLVISLLLSSKSWG